MRAPKRVPVPPMEVGQPIVEAEEARWMERYEFVCNQRTLGVSPERLIREVQGKFKMTKDAARTLTRECLATYVSSTAAELEHNREAAKRRSILRIGRLLGIASASPEENTRIQALRACTMEERFLAELQGTMEALEVRVTNVERREVITAVVDKMTDEELEAYANGQGSEGKPPTTH